MAISVATTGALLLTLGTGIAAAQTTLTQPTVDANKTGNIHLTKYDNANDAIEPTGGPDEEAPDNSKALQGIKFTLTKVNSAPGLDNLTTAVTTRVDNAQLKKLAALRAPEVEAELAKETPTAGWSFTKVNEQTTNNQGKIDWKGLQLGVYLLQETGTTTTDNKSYKRSPASLIFFPMTHPNKTT